MDTMQEVDAILARAKTLNCAPTRLAKLAKLSPRTVLDLAQRDPRDRRGCNVRTLDALRIGLAKLNAEAVADAAAANARAELARQPITAATTAAA